MPSDYDSSCTFTAEELISDFKTDNIKVTFRQILNIKAGDTYTMNDVGVLYYNKKQYKKAMQWYTLAVDDDMPVVACNIGQLFHLGLGVPVDYLRALKWYLKAARLADKYVYYNIASLFENGLGVPVDREKAVEWYLKYDEDADFITRYLHEGNEVSSKQKEKPLGRLIREAEDVLENATQKKRREKRNNEHSIPSFDQNRANEHLHLLERDYKRVLDLVADLKDMMADMQSSNKRKYQRMNDEIKSLQDCVIDLKDNSKKLLERIRDLEDDGAKYKRHRSDGSKG